MRERSFLFISTSLLVLFMAGFSLACQRCTTTAKVPDSTTAPTVATLSYTLDKPSAVYEIALPGLQEISGLSPTSMPNVLCAISDEKGELFLIELTDKATITKNSIFKDKGDFEGIEMVGEIIYAIKSDGDLYEITQWQSEKPLTQVYENPHLDGHDIEGLCFDAKRNALLIAGKEDPESPVKRGIWGFDLKTKQTSEKPLYSFDPSKVHDLVPLIEEDKDRFFSTSGIAVSPVSGDLYLLSTSLKRLLIMDYATGQIKQAVRLEKSVLPQPEGITFDSKGNLFICSEAKKQPAFIARFDFPRQ